MGCFVGGWIADRVGRINGLFYASFFCLIGGALQAATQSSDFIIVARVVTGLGTGALTGITPVLTSEVASAQHRGGFLGYVFIANCKFSVRNETAYLAAKVDHSQTWASQSHTGWTLASHSSTMGIHRFAGVSSWLSSASQPSSSASVSSCSPTVPDILSQQAAPRKRVTYSLQCVVGMIKMSKTSFLRFAPCPSTANNLRR